MLEKYYSNNSLQREKIALGLLKNKEFIYAFGRNDDVGATEVFLAHGGVYGLPETAETITATSDSVNDVVGGTGARTIKLRGLDSDYNIIEEVVDMGASSVNEFLRLFDVEVITAGKTDAIGGGNDGTITISQDTSGTDMLIIAPNEGKNLSACFTVPAGHKALLWDADTTAGAGKDSTNRIKSRKSTADAPFTVGGTRDNYQNLVGQKFSIPRVYDEKTDIVFTTTSSAAGTSVSGALSLVIIDMHN